MKFSLFLELKFLIELIGVLHSLASFSTLPDSLIFAFNKSIIFLSFKFFTNLINKSYKTKKSKKILKLIKKYFFFLRIKKVCLHLQSI